MSESSPEPTAIGAARQALAEALRTVQGIRVYTDPGARIDPPAAILSLPDLQWESGCLAPTSATFSIALVVKQNDKAIDVLQEYVLVVTEAIDEVASAVVLNARIGAWNDELPAYEIETEVAL